MFDGDPSLDQDAKSVVGSAVYSAAYDQVYPARDITPGLTFVTDGLRYT